MPGAVSFFTVRRTWCWLCLALVGCFFAPVGLAEDSLHASWQRQLAQHVVVTEQGRDSRVDYAAWRADKAQLDGYLKALGQVSKTTYESWPSAQQLAFLINAYNAFTVQLILTRYPDLDSIKDIGGWFSGPWSQDVGVLLGQPRTLDEIEHGMIRGQLGSLRRAGFNGFAEPRIHFAVNCASISCPPLRNEAYVGARLDAQLADQTRQFLAHRQRNWLDGDTLWVSKLFDWYASDFHLSGEDSIRPFLAKYSEALGLDEAQQQALQQGNLNIRFADYDWGLNALER